MDDSKKARASSKAITSIKGAETRMENMPEPLVEMRMDFPSGLNLSPVQSTCKHKVQIQNIVFSTVIWGKTGRVKNFKVILKIFHKCFLEFFFHKKIHN
jgi:hypothetical protein